MLGTDNLTLDELEEYEERAGIMEYDGGLTREEAEKEAMKIIERKRNEKENIY